MSPIDSHLHLWDLAEGGYSWLTPESGELYRTYAATEARKELDRAGIDSAILVQAEDSAADTQFMLTQASAHDWIVGVVGWIPLDAPAAAEQALAAYLQEASFVGVRHLVHEDPRDDFLSLPAAQRHCKGVGTGGAWSAVDGRGTPACLGPCAGRLWALPADVRRRLAGLAPRGILCGDQWGAAATGRPAFRRRAGCVHGVHRSCCLLESDARNPGRFRATGNDPG